MLKICPINVSSPSPFLDSHWDSQYLFAKMKYFKKVFLFMIKPYKSGMKFVRSHWFQIISTLTLNLFPPAVLVLTALLLFFYTTSVYLFLWPESTFPLYDIIVCVLGLKHLISFMEKKQDIVKSKRTISI